MGNTPKPKGRKAVIYSVNILLLVSIGSGIVWAIRNYFELNENSYTNDAQVEEYISPVNTRIPGYIKEVRFTEHQRVKKGDTLVIIDDREYRIQVRLAEAALVASQASGKVVKSSVQTVKSNLQVSDANINAADTRLWNAAENFHRYENLLKEGAATQQQYDQAKTEYNSLLAQKQALQSQKQTTGFATQEAASRLHVNAAEVMRAQASLDMAKLNLSYTAITAPYDGTAGRRIIQEGQLLQAGQLLLSFVKDEQKWVVANYKETEFARLHIGKKMEVRVDAYGEKKLLGVITAISQATGAKYSGVPVDNATGNFVKVQQRIPVRIDFLRDQNQLSQLDLLRAGMNVEVTAAKQ